MYLVYQIVLVMVILIFSPYYFYKGVFAGKGFAERFGFWKFSPSKEKVVWFHAASVGELKAIAAIIPLIRQKKTNLRPIITTITQTGRNKAANLDLGVEVFYAPFDLGFAVANAVGRVRPAVLILVETEIWPILVNVVKNANVPIVIANGRLSRKSFANYKYVKPVVSAVLKKIDFIMAQSEEDAQRFLALGADPNRVAVFGNIKFDQISNCSRQMVDELIPFFNGKNDFIFIAGSVRNKEIPAITETLVESFKKIKSLKAIIAPRYMRSLGVLERNLTVAGLSYFKRSELELGGQKDNLPNIMILDSMGELGALYSWANLSFVGGSLVPIGGHDPLEPASVGCAVSFGPYMENSRLAAKQLIQSGGACQVNNSRQLTELVVRLADDRQSAKEMGEKARRLVLKHSGVSERIVSKLTEFLQDD
jgi:3-deoxy-D-manno-octulosonic-acid transferase